MSARAPKSKKSSAKGRVKVDPREEVRKLKVDREETKNRRTPMSGLSAAVKKDEPSGVKHDDEKAKKAKPEDTKQEPAKRETNNTRLSRARLWEHHSDGQRYVPRPDPVRMKLEEAADDPDFNFEREDSVHGQEPPPSPPPQLSPHPQRQVLLAYCDSRPIPRVEVVLPRWEDVRRRQATRAAQPQRDRRQLGEASAAEQAARQNSIFIKPDPEDDVKPLLALEGHDPVEAREVLRTAVQNLRNPVAKVKKELLLNDEFLLDALTWEGINYKYPIPLPKEVSEFQLHRNYISHLYGGGPQETSPTPRKEMVDWHGLTDWMFLSLGFNPHAPTRPGHSGLFFDEEGQAQDNWHEIRRTFVRVKSGKWVYMGQYQMKPGISLSTDLWKTQKASVRNAWAKGIMRARWGKANCIRIWLRKQHGVDYKVTEQDYAEGDGQIEYIRGRLTEEDVIGAFDRGEEEMGTYQMTYVGYDVEFVEVLVRNVPAWVIFDKAMKAKRAEMKAKRAEKKGKGGGKGTRKQAQKGKGTGSKRKPIEIESESEEDEGEDGDGDVKMEVQAGSDDSYQGTSAELPHSSTGRPRRAAAMVKRQRTS